MYVIMIINFIDNIIFIDLYLFSEYKFELLFLYLQYSLYYLANGDFFGELMVMLVKLFLKKEIYLIFLQVFLEVLKI